MANKKNESVPFLTPWFVARYPKISKADTQGKYADLKFKTDGVFESDEDLTKVEAALEAAAAKFWPGEKDVTMPVMDFYKNAEAKEKGDVEARGIRMKSKYKPACFDAKKKKLPEGVAIGGGSIIRVASAIFPWSKKTKFKGKEVTEYGISMRLGDVQVRKLEQWQGSGDGSAFDEDEGGFEYEGGDEDRAEQFGDATAL